MTSQARPSGCRIQSDVDEWSRPLMDDGVTLSGCPDEHRAPVFGGQIPGSHRIVSCCREDLNIVILIGYNTVYRSVSAWFFYKTKLTCFHYTKETHEDMEISFVIDVYMDCSKSQWSSNLVETGHRIDGHSMPNLQQL